MTRTLQLAVACLSISLAACGDHPTREGGGGGGGGGTNPGPPASLAAVGGGGQTVPAGQPAIIPLVVKLTDAQGRAVPNATVTFAAAAGSGSVAVASVPTGADGQAQTSWTVGPSAGTHSVSATVGGLTATFTATVTPNGTISGTVALTDSLIPSPVRMLAALPLSSFGATPKAATFLGRPAAAAPPAAGTRATDVPGVLIVTLRPPAVGAPAAATRARMTRGQAATLAERMARALDGHVRPDRRLRDVSPVLAAARMEVRPGTEEQAAAELRANPAVLRVERDGYGYAAAGVQPNDPLLTAQAWHYQMVDVPRAWRRTTGSTGVLVAVVDDGTRFDHPDLAPNLTADGYDFVSSTTTDTNCGVRDNAGDGNGYDPDPTTPMRYDGCAPDAAGGHGLHVAGTIGAVGNNGMGMSGVAWTVRIRPVRVLGTLGRGSWFDIAQGVLYAAGLPASDGAGGVVQAPSAARIINMSLGGTTDGTVLRDAVAAATSAGALVVVSAGNDGTSVPAYPAVYPEVIAVSAVGPNYQRARYSNWGAHVDVAAPGGDPGGGPYAGVGSTLWNFAGGTPTYGMFYGTSMAAPHVSGAAALLLAREPSLTAAQLRARLLDHALDLGAAGPDPVFGAGLLNVRNSLAATRALYGRTFGRVYNAATGGVVREGTGSGTSFSIGQLDDGAYYVFAGIDDEDDGIFGTNGARWGGLTAADGTLQALTIQGAGTYPAAFTIGFGSEREPNNVAANATRMMLGGSLYGGLSSTGDLDVYSITVPAGSYVFETVGWAGTCGLTINADTELTLRDPAGTVLAVHDDIHSSVLNYCSRISRQLAAGTYTLTVSGHSAGWYRVIARPA